MPKNVYGATYSRIKPAQITSEPAQESIIAIATAISSVNQRIVSILDQITQNPDITTKKIVLERIEILRDELSDLFK